MATEGLTPLPGATFNNDYNVNVKVPFVLDEKGNKVYQILHYPFQVTANPKRINREETLGYFHVLQRKFLREYLDDYLEMEDIYKMATLSRGWNLVTNEEKYVLLIILLSIIVVYSIQPPLSPIKHVVEFQKLIFKALPMDAAIPFKLPIRLIHRIYLI